MMILFFKHLIQTLDQKSPKWRSSYYWLLDNASWHKSTKVLKFLEDHSVPVLYTGSYSYDAGKLIILMFNHLLFIAPIELLFSAFKSKDINPRHVPLTKR